MSFGTTGPFQKKCPFFYSTDDMTNASDRKTTLFSRRIALHTRGCLVSVSVPGLKSGKWQWHMKLVPDKTGICQEYTCICHERTSRCVLLEMAKKFLVQIEHLTGIHLKPYAGNAPVRSPDSLEDFLTMAVRVSVPTSSLPFSICPSRPVSLFSAE
jgi:hypothetical protein